MKVAPFTDFVSRNDLAGTEMLAPAACCQSFVTGHDIADAENSALQALQELGNKGTALAGPKIGLMNPGL
jgi:hypothetical protein